MEEVRLQDKLGNENFHENMKNLYEPIIDTIKITSENLTKAMMLTSNENNRAIENLNDKLLETMNDRCKITSYLLSLLSKITNAENTSRFRLVNNSNSNRLNDSLIYNSRPITL